MEFYQLLTYTDGVDINEKLNGEGGYDVRNEETKAGHAV